MYLLVGMGFKLAASTYRMIDPILGFITLLFLLD